MGSNKTKDFFSLHSGQKKNEIILHATFTDDSFKVSSGEIEYSKPLFTNIKLGNKLYDVLFFDDGVNMVISERLFRLLKNNNITGWKTYPVSINNVKNKYYGFQIIGKSDKLIEPRDEGFYKGYKFDVNTWDGSDFFSPNDTNLRFITEKLKVLLENNEVTNIDIDNIKDIEAYSFGDSSII